MMPQATRREFLGAASAGVLATTLMRSASSAAAASAVPAVPGIGYTKTRILRVYLGGGRPSWPRPDLNLEDEVKRLQAEMEATPGLEDVEFLNNTLVQNPGNLVRLLEQFKDVDGVLAVPVCLGYGHSLTVLADSGIPTVSLAIPYSGHEWCIVPEMQRLGKKIDVLPTSDLTEVSKAVRAFRTIHRLRETKVLFIGGGYQPPAPYVEEVKKVLGVEIKTFDHKKLVEAYEAIDPAKAAEDAQGWIRQAEKVVEPSKEDIVKSARLSLALQAVLAAEKAQAVTINCLGLFGIGGLPAYPCLGFARLNDIGLTGVCEADLPSTLTQVIYQHLIGKPGFVTDPVIDTSNGTVIHAHCVSATKMDGPEGESAPYLIRTHLEDYKGASLQVKMRIGQEITMAKLVTGDARAMTPAQPALAASPVSCFGTGTMLASTGTIVDVPDTGRGCRTQVTVKVRDARKMLEGWCHGLHRVIFYGDHMADTRRLGRFIGFNVVEEG